MTASSNNNPPRVTVLMAVWRADVPEHLRLALKSVRNQTFSDWECLVVVDGAITPELEAVLAETAKSDPRVRVVRQETQRGPAAVRNMGVREARGEYIAILDADDLAEPERLARQWTVMRETGVDVLGSWVGLIDGGGADAGCRELPLEDAGIKDILWWRNPVAHSSAMLRAAALRKHPYDEQLRYGEDYRLWVTLARRNCRFMNLPEVLVRYRVNDRPKPHGGARHRAWSDLGNRMGALRLYPVTVALRRQPLVVLSALARLAPPSLWRVLRAWRDKETANPAGRS